MTDPATRAVRIETCVSIAINALIPAGIIWLVGIPGPEALGGATGLVQGMLKAAGLATLLMTLVLTAILRARLRKGGLPRTPAVTGPGRFLPARLLPRAIVLALAAIALLVPLGTLAALALHILPLTRVGLLIFNIAFGAMVGLTMAPPLVRRALADLC
ncbi:hypothetical protein [Sphingomonas sp.]|uniref:hypothetical protein n=1 Tax=Sphingomonas sp. TaxID=28214 RepID=UPI003CC6C18A